MKEVASWCCPRCGRPFGARVAARASLGEGDSGKQIYVLCPDCLEETTFSLEGKVHDRRRWHCRRLDISPQFNVGGGEVVLLDSYLEELAYDGDDPVERRREVGFRKEPDRITRYRSLSALHADLDEHFTRLWFERNAEPFARFVVDWLEMGRLVYPVARFDVDACVFQTADEKDRIWRHRLAIDGFRIESELAT